jgi:hypothetical protein
MTFRPRKICKSVRSEYTNKIQVLYSRPDVSTNKESNCKHTGIYKCVWIVKRIRLSSNRTSTVAIYSRGTEIARTDHHGQAICSSLYM